MSSTIDYYFLTIQMHKFRHGSNPNHLIHFGRSGVNHYTTGVAGGNTYKFWQKYRRKLSDYLNQIDVIAILKVLQGLVSVCFTPGLQLQSPLN